MREHLGSWVFRSVWHCVAPCHASHFKAVLLGLSSSECRLIATLLLDLGGLSCYSLYRNYRGNVYGNRWYCMILVLVLLVLVVFSYVFFALCILRAMSGFIPLFFCDKVMLAVPTS